MQRPLSHLGYISKAVNLMTDQQLDHLLERARDRNQQKDITGMLLYADGSFLQVIEGPPESIQEIFSIIEMDPQHEKINVLFEEDLAEKNFVNWTMGFRRLNSDEIIKAPGMNHYLQGEESLNDYFIERSRPGALLQNMLTYFKQAA